MEEHMPEAEGANTLTAGQLDRFSRQNAALGTYKWPCSCDNNPESMEETGSNFFSAHNFLHHTSLSLFSNFKIHQELKLPQNS